jgi:hypothetical protein
MHWCQVKVRVAPYDMESTLMPAVDQAELSNIFSSHAYQASAYSLPKLDYLGR